MRQLEQLAIYMAAFFAFAAAAKQVLNEETHNQYGEPGKRVWGSYRTVGETGEIVDIKYIADNLGFRAYDGNRAMGVMASESTHQFSSKLQHEHSPPMETATINEEQSREEKTTYPATEDVKAKINKDGSTKSLADPSIVESLKSHESSNEESNTSIKNTNSSPVQSDDDNTKHEKALINSTKTVSMLIDNEEYDKNTQNYTQMESQVGANVPVPNTITQNHTEKANEEHINVNEEILNSTTTESSSDLLHTNLSDTNDKKALEKNVSPQKNAADIEKPESEVVTNEGKVEKSRKEAPNMQSEKSISEIRHQANYTATPETEAADIEEEGITTANSSVSQEKETSDIEQEETELEEIESDGIDADSQIENKTDIEESEDYESKTEMLEEESNDMDDAMSESSVENNNPVNDTESNVSNLDYDVERTDSKNDKKPVSFVSANSSSKVSQESLTEETLEKKLDAQEKALNETTDSPIEEENIETTTQSSTTQSQQNGLNKKPQVNLAKTLSIPNIYAQLLWLMQRQQNQLPHITSVGSDAKLLQAADKNENQESLKKDNRLGKTLSSKNTFTISQNERGESETMHEAHQNMLDGSMDISLPPIIKTSSNQYIIPIAMMLIMPQKNEAKSFPTMKTIISPSIARIKSDVKIQRLKPTLVKPSIR